MGRSYRNHQLPDEHHHLFPDDQELPADRSPGDTQKAVIPQSGQPGPDEERDHPPQMRHLRAYRSG